MNKLSSTQRGALASSAIVGEFDQKRLYALTLLNTGEELLTDEQREFLANFDVEFEDVTGQKLSEIAVKCF
jgi:hypothetical protein